MKMKILAALMAAVMALSLAACGNAEEAEETTLTGMVVGVEGTVISLVETDDMIGSFGGGERPGNFGDFDPESFDGTMPTGEGFSGWGGGMPEDMTLPEGMTVPEGGRMPNFDGELPEGMTVPEGGQRPDFSGELPEGMTMPEDGQMPDFEGRGDFDLESMSAQTKSVDIGSAHISVQTDGVKAGGSMDDIKVGATVTVTLNSKGEATYVLVTGTGFSGGQQQ